MIASLGTGWLVIFPLAALNPMAIIKGLSGTTLRDWDWFAVLVASQTSGAKQIHLRSGCLYGLVMVETSDGSGGTGMSDLPLFL